MTKLEKKQRQIMTELSNLVDWHALPNSVLKRFRKYDKEIAKLEKKKSNDENK